MRRLGNYSGLVLALFGMAVFVWVVPRLYGVSRSTVSAEMQVALPRFVQVLMAGGDRFLAANISGFRALVASTENMGPENYRIQAIVQSDAAWFNPGHEDNYYIAAAILPWNGEVAASQTILRRATEARRFDWQPPLYYGFNLMHFLKKPAAAADWLQESSRYFRDETMQLEFQQTAALWVAKGEDPLFAIRMHRAMARETKNPAFARFLENRAVRLENLYAIDQAVDTYRQRQGRKPASLSELLEARIMPSVPKDPFGANYELGPAGKAKVAAKRVAAAKEHP